MIATTAPDARHLFEAARGLPKAARVDRKSRTIFGAKALQVGPLNPGDARPWKVDQTSLSQLVDYVNAKQNGAKMRFAHPNMSRDGMGRHIGRATNPQIIKDPTGDYVGVDAVLNNAQAGSRTADMVDHVLSMAESAPEDFGLSIAPLLDHEAMGKIEPDANGLIPIRIKGLHAIDFVDDPAATRGGLFSLDSDCAADLPAMATGLLDTFFAEAPADVIRARFGEFLERYLKNRGEKAMSTNAPAVGGGELKKTEEKPDATPVVNPDLGAPVTEPGKILASATAVLRSTEADEAREQLKRHQEIGALCKLAKVDDTTRDLMLKAGFNRAEAQDYLKASGLLAVVNPPVVEGVEPPKKEVDPDAKFKAEYEQNAATFASMGVTVEMYVKSRKIG